VSLFDCIHIVVLDMTHRRCVHIQANNQADHQCTMDDINNSHSHSPRQEGAAWTKEEGTAGELG
jgi:hypothetical protein